MFLFYENSIELFIFHETCIGIVDFKKGWSINNSKREHCGCIIKLIVCFTSLATEHKLLLIKAQFVKGTVFIKIHKENVQKDLLNIRVCNGFIFPRHFQTTLYLQCIFLVLNLILVFVWAKNKTFSIRDGFRKIGRGFRFSMGARSPPKFYLWNPLKSVSSALETPSNPSLFNIKVRDWFTTCTELSVFLLIACKGGRGAPDILDRYTDS